MKTHAMRLTFGNDLKKEIETYCLSNCIQSACLVTCVGCVVKCHLRLADGITTKEVIDKYEIVSLTGTIAGGHSHLHICLSDQQGNCIGGHLLEGTIINTTAEIVLMEMDNVTFSREYDESTGYDELVIKNNLN